MTGEAQPHPYIFFLGSHPSLSRLEVLRVLTARELSPIVREESEQYLIVQVKSRLNEQLQDVLGGSDRFAHILGTFPALPTAADINALLPSSIQKVSVGLSGLGVDAGYLNRLGVELKDARAGKVRFVLPNGKAERLNAAQVMAHKLDKEPNAEFTIVRTQNGSWSVGRTVAVQDIGAYELRDTKRPFRDPAVGLLPPKLAQMMLNFALSPDRTRETMQILDPFCGMGTVLQEGWLMDHVMIGSDSSERMIRGSEKNLTWLGQHFNLSEAKRPHLFIHQANTRWSKRWHGAVDAVVTEPFLGKPLRKPLPKAQLEKHINELGALYHRVFTTLRPVLKEQGLLVFILPAFRMERGGEEWQLFPERFLDALARVGYSKDQLGTGERSEMLYARPTALVGREITVWQKI